MAQFRKKPIVIEAVRWSENCHFAEMTSWLSDAIGIGPKLGGVMRLKDRIHVFTLEGIMIADPGDWIIRGIKGELYPCKPDIFEATYEAVIEPAASKQEPPCEHGVADGVWCKACSQDRKEAEERFLRNE